MAIRFDDLALSIALSVHDLADDGGLSGHLSKAEGSRSGAARMAAGRRVHTGWQAARAQEEAGFASEVRLERELRVGRWTVRVHGRVDGARCVIRPETPTRWALRTHLPLPW